MNKIDKKIKCVHCGQEIIVDNASVVVTTCSCGKVSTNNGIVTEGVQGTDWVDVSQQLLNG